MDISLAISMAQVYMPGESMDYIEEKLNGDFSHGEYFRPNFFPFVSEKFHMMYNSVPGYVNSV